MNQQQFFEDVIRHLEKLGIPYMISGSLGAMLYGEPRLTNDMDIIISKLNYYKIGGSEKHILDIRSMMAVSGEELDFEYLRDWVDRLDLQSEWETVTN